MTLTAFIFSSASTIFSAIALVVSITVAKRTSEKTLALRVAQSIGFDYIDATREWVVVNDSTERAELISVAAGSAIHSPKTKLLSPSARATIQVPADLSRTDAEDATLTWTDLRRAVWQRTPRSGPHLVDRD